MSSSISPELAELGWDERWAALVDPGAQPGRITLQGQDVWRVHDGRREVPATVRGRLRRDRDPDALPVTGDWVTLSAPSDGAALIESIVPRRTTLLRKVAGRTSAGQVLAANVDVVAVAVPADAVNPRRVEREVTLAWESGATPLVVVTKADLRAYDLQEALEVLAEVAPGVDVIVTSSYDHTGLDDLVARLSPGTTLAVIGASGAGKSSLGNALSADDRLITRPVRDDGRGRHTTSARELVLLPCGALLLDTPGMREVGLWVGEDGLDSTFADVESYAQGCRFRDCRHESEPGCTVLAAVDSGALDGTRLLSWRRLQRELAHLERRHDARLRAEQRRHWVQITKAVRGRSRP